MRGLRARLLLAFLLVIIVMLCSISATLLVILARNPLEDRQAIASLQAQALGIATFLRNTTETFPPAPRWARVLQQVATEQELRIAWAEREGTIRFDSEKRWVGQSLQQALKAPRAQPDSRWQGIVQDEGERWVVVGIPWPDANEPRGMLVVATPTARVPAIRRFRQTLLSPMLEAGLLALAVGFILAVIISRSIARPLQQVAGAAESLAQGNLDARAPVEGPEEVRALARSFNEMGHRVQTSQQAQRDLVANVAHDLRTPLTSVQGFAQALVDGTASTPETQRQAAEAIYEEAGRMRRMVDALLDLARFEAGQVEMERRPVDLAELVRKRVAAFRPRAEEADIELRAEVLEEAVVLPADEGRLAQVLDNLLSNALKYTASGGRVTVIVESAPPWAQMAVTDTGRGIPPEDLARIFQRFYRADKARGGESAGLGLAIVREIVRAHGGTVTAESVVGVGSKFTVRLPLAPES